jgi:glycerol-3-phosphate dehydrogenase subunit B
MMETKMAKYDTVVIGAGLAGLTAGCLLARANQKVLLVSEGIGALLLSSGAIDVLGFHPPEAWEPVRDPLGALEPFFAERPDHPYRLAGRQGIESGLEAFRRLVNDAGLDYRGTPDRNWLLPSAAGAVHPTCLAPASLIRGELSEGGRMLIVGFRELRDFYPGVVSQNLNAQALDVEAVSLVIDLPAPATGKMNITPIELARAFEETNFRHGIVQAILAQSKGYDRIGFPAVLGLSQHAEVLADLEKRLERPVFEISTLPPSVPGHRLYEALKRAFLSAGGRLILGSKVADGTIRDGRVTQIRFETVNRPKPVEANHFILASGGIFGGGIQTDEKGNVWETVFGLPVSFDADRHKWFAPRFIVPTGQPIGYAGLYVNERWNPIDQDRAPLAENLYVAGAALAGSNWISGRTGNGVAVTTATAIARQIQGANISRRTL